MNWKTYAPLLAALAAGLIVGFVVARSPAVEGFLDVEESNCRACRRPRPSCECPKKPGCDPEDKKRCPAIDWSKYVLKSSIPPARHSPT